MITKKFIGKVGNAKKNIDTAKMGPKTATEEVEAAENFGHPLPGEETFWSDRMGRSVVYPYPSDYKGKGYLIAERPLSKVRSVQLRELQRRRRNQRPPIKLVPQTEGEEREEQLKKFTDMHNLRRGGAK